MTNNIQIIKNNINNKTDKSGLPSFFAEKAVQDVIEYHKAGEHYGETPLVRLSGLAKELGIADLYVKDESKRFGLNAFKGLGASYAVDRLVRELEGNQEDRPAGAENIPDAANISDATTANSSEITLVTATDGNHGRAVAWAAKQRGMKAFVFMPEGSSSERAEAIRAQGAHVEITDLNYADSTRYARKFAEENGYHLVQDTASPGYNKIPDWITLGYTMMVDEAVSQMEKSGGGYPTHVVIQAGVGSAAGAVAGYFALREKDELPKIIVVEPMDVACFYESIEKGRIVNIGGNPKTDMAGLNCGEPNISIFGILENYGAFFARCTDQVTWNGMRLLADPINGDAKVVSGESGAVGAGLINEICSRDDCRSYREMLGLDDSSSVLVFSTEGDTDKENYKKIVGSDPALGAI